MASDGIVADIIATQPPKAVVEPHGKNSFAVEPAGRRLSAVEQRILEERQQTDVESQDREKYPAPTDEERSTLRKIAGGLPGVAYGICVVEFAERASYYGVKQILSNFMQFPLPKGGNGAGAPPRGTQETAGALGRGLTFSNAFVLLFLFLAYVIPIYGAYVADVQLGRLKVIWIGVLLCGIAHVIMIGGAAPSVLQAGNGLAPFLISFFMLAFGAGMFKPNVAPTLLDQLEYQKSYTKILKSGEKVIIDPEATVQKVMLLFYGFINVGAFLAIATTYCEKDVGYWLAFLIPGIVYFLLPGVLAFLHNKLIKKPPQGSILKDTFKATWLALKLNNFKVWNKGFFDRIRPSNLKKEGITSLNGQPIPWNDKFADDLRRTYSACGIFCFYPIWYMNDGGIGSLLSNQGAAMTTNGAPNDLLNNFNPVTLMVTVPVLSYIVYPALRRYNISFKRIDRITLGFAIAAISGAIGAIVQWRVYETSPCGYNASDCDIGTGVSHLSIWWQIPNVSLGAISECLVNVTGYELAYARAPENMKAVVMALFLFNTAVSAALAEALSPVTKDPYLIWMWGAPAVALALLTIIFRWLYRDMNDDEFMTYADEEDALNEASSRTDSSARDSGDEKGPTLSEKKVT